MSTEFKTFHVTPLGLQLMNDIDQAYAILLERLDQIGMQPGRERSLVITKLQEACHFAKVSIASREGNHQ